MATNKKFAPKTEGVNIDEGVITETSVAKQDFIQSNDSPTANSEGVQSNPDVEQKEPARTVRVCPAVDHSCCIGGTRYNLKKGVCQNVPPEVKSILNKNGLLSPL